MEEESLSNNTEKPNQFRQLLSRKYFKYYGMGLIVVLLILLGLVYKNQQNEKKQYQADLKAKRTLTPTPTLAPPLTSFQKTLTKHCGKDVSRINPNEFERIYLENLPLDFSETKVTSHYLRDNHPTASCDGFSNKQYALFDVEDTDPYTLYIYDDLSETPGRGGGPSISLYGETIKQTDDITITIISSNSSNTPLERHIMLANKASIHLMGSRKLLTGNNETLYIKISSIKVREENDPLVLDYFKPYTKTEDLSDKDIGLGVVDVIDAPSDVLSGVKLKNYFFGDLNNLLPPEKQALEKIEKELASYQIKPLVHTITDNKHMITEIGISFEIPEGYSVTSAHNYGNMPQIKLDNNKTGQFILFDSGGATVDQYKLIKEEKIVVDGISGDLAAVVNIMTGELASREEEDSLTWQTAKYGKRTKAEFEDKQGRNWYVFLPEYEVADPITADEALAEARSFLQTIEFTK